MKKSSITVVLLVLFSTLFISCTKDKETEPPPATGFKRNVVIEVFTYHHCPNCPIAEKAIDSLFGIHGDSLTVVEYHVRQAGDTLTPCSTFVNNRIALYTVGGYPTVIFDGEEKHTGVTGDMFNTFLNYLSDRFSKKSDLKITTLDASFINSTSISFNTRIFSDQDISGRLFFVLAEDSVAFEDSLYHFVVRQVYPDENGMVFSVSEDDTFGTNGSILLSWQPIGDVWLNIFVQNMSNNTIYQGGSINLGKAPAPQIPYKFDATVSPDTFQTGTSGEPTIFSFLLSNTGSDSDRYYIEANQIEHVPGWSWMICYGGLCKTPDHGTIHDTIPRLGSLPIASQESDSFTVDVIPNPTTGTEKINVKITSAGDTTVTESINIYTELQ